MRVALFGQAAFGADVFKALKNEKVDIVGVSTPREQGKSDPLRDAARNNEIPIIATPDLKKNTFFEEYLSWQADLLVFAFVTDIVRKNVLDAAQYGAIQYHPSLLPLYRGRSAMNWPIINGAKKTGISIFWVDEGIDTGPILLQREVDISLEESMGSLYFNKLYPMGVKSLVESVKMIQQGSAPRIEQNHDDASYEPPCGPEHSEIDFMKPGWLIYNLVRGCDPQPGASAQLEDIPIRLFGASYYRSTKVDQPGTVLEVDNEGARIACIGGILNIQRIQKIGESKIDAAELLKPGQQLR
tara:strand:+ start:11309 stop:12205 length:897 start_codon:yes stop_codon:yes gene_type:complete